MRQYDQIDWNRMWSLARKNKGSGKKRSAASWDARADSFRQRTHRSVYIEKFLHLLQPQPGWRVLDMGCGPGTLALPLAKVVRRVTAVDFSSRMLALLREEASRRKIGNISAVQASWEDDWRKRSITVHDVVIASRSLSVADLQAALEKATAFAGELVVITDRVRHGPLDPDAFAAVGRPMKLGPDYIYTLNLLYQMGIEARVDFIRLDETQSYASLDKAVEGFLWMFREELKTQEREALAAYVRSIARRSSRGDWEIRRRRPPVWAYISWQPRE